MFVSRGFPLRHLGVQTRRVTARTSWTNYLRPSVASCGRRLGAWSNGSSIGDQTASLWSGRAGPSGPGSGEWGQGHSHGGQQYDWINSVMETMSNFNSSPEFTKAAFYHPDDHNETRDLRQCIQYPLTSDELFAVAERLEHRLLYPYADPPLIVADAVNECMNLPQLLREHAIARQTGTPLYLPTIFKLSQTILAFAMIYHTTPVGTWITQSKDTEALWELQTTLERIICIARVNVALRKISSFAEDQGLQETTGNGFRRQPALDAVQVVNTAFSIGLAISDQQYLDKEWFDSREQVLLLKVAGKMRKTAEKLQPKIESLGRARVDTKSKDVEQIVNKIGEQLTNAIVKDGLGNVSSRNW